MDTQKEANNVVNWVKEYVLSSGAKGVVVGNSGGKDSACVIAIAAKALGSENVIAVAIPINSKASDMEDVKLVADTFKVKTLTVDLTECYNSMQREINKELCNCGHTKTSNEARVNMKPRLRMTTLYSIAQTMGYLVMGTGNLCERTVRVHNKMGG